MAMDWSVSAVLALILFVCAVPVIKKYSFV